MKFILHKAQEALENATVGTVVRVSIAKLHYTFKF